MGDLSTPAYHHHNNGTFSLELTYVRDKTFMSALLWLWREGFILSCTELSDFQKKATTSNVFVFICDCCFSRCQDGFAHARMNIALSNNNLLRCHWGLSCTMFLRISRSFDYRQMAASQLSQSPPRVVRIIARGIYNRRATECKDIFPLSSTRSWTLEPRWNRSSRGTILRLAWPLPQYLGRHPLNAPQPLWYSAIEYP
eukprot:scaffold4927_cov139-Amphora_coffeaeformis.AAC.14